MPDTVSGEGRVDAFRVPKIPPFWRQAPEAWFIQIEASFRNSSISVDRTKVDYLLTGLDPEVITQVIDLVTADPSPEGLYELLKERILSTFAALPEARLRQLLKGQVLGDQKPSHLLNQMKQLNGGQCNTAVLRSLFIELLPETHKAILVATNEPDLHKLAEIADRLAEINHPSTSATVVAPINERKREKSDSSSSTNEKLDKLIKQFQSLSNTVAKMRRDRSSSRKRTFKKSEGSNNHGKQSGYCFIHRKYGKGATSCRKPCSWKDEDSSEN